MRKPAARGKGRLQCSAVCISSCSRPSILGAFKEPHPFASTSFLHVLLCLHLYCLMSLTCLLPSSVVLRGPTRSRSSEQPPPQPKVLPYSSSSCCPTLPSFPSPPLDSQGITVTVRPSAVEPFSLILNAFRPVSVLFSPFICGLLTRYSNAHLALRPEHCGMWLLHEAQDKEFGLMVMGGEEDVIESGSPFMMIMSPTTLMTLPTWDVNFLQAWKCHLLPWRCSSVTDIHPQWEQGCDWMTGAHCVMGSPSLSLLYWMASCCYGWPQTSEHAIEFAHPFHVT